MTLVFSSAVIVGAAGAVTVAKSARMLENSRGLYVATAKAVVVATATNEEAGGSGT